MNNVVLAREAVRRFAEHKDVVRKFIQTFENRGSGTPDAKFGFFKYKSLLRSAINRHCDTIFIDLEDLEQFCKRELQGDGGQPRFELQQSLGLLIQDIENNTQRYRKYFYEACEAEKPERDEGFNRLGADPANDKVQEWRERQMQRRLESGQPVGSMPPQMRNPFEVRFKPRKDAKTLMFREVTAQFVGALVQLECLVVRASEVKPRIEVVAYQCEMCESEIFLSVESEMYAPPKQCPSTQCSERKQSGKLRCNNRTSKFGKYQELRVQELSEHVPVGGVPRGMNVVLCGDLCRSCGPGDTITLCGVYTPYQLPWLMTMQKGTAQEMYIDGHHIKKHKSGYNEQNEDEQALARRVDDAHRLGNIYEMAGRSIAPEIFGHADVKKTLLLSLISGVTKNMSDGLKIRGEIHCLFMGDPGVAKSQLLKQVCNIAPRSVYTTGKGTSGVGLTATVVKDKISNEVTLEGGALVLADMGVCCIDEFDKMDESDRTSIHEVMEQQSVSIAKAGITTTLNTRTTIMAAANPVKGRYDPWVSPVENMNLPPALLSRFDLIFLLLDTVDEEKDRMLANHVCKVHTTFGKKSDKKPEDGSGADSGDALSLGFKPFDAHFMRAYVRKAKTYEPLLEDSLVKDVIDAYVSLRDEEKKGDHDSRKSYTTPRTLLSILRISQSHARARFSMKVERQDFEEAMRLMKSSKESVEVSAPAKRGQSPLDVVHDIVADLARTTKNKEGWVELAHVVSMGGHKALNRDQVLEALEQWESFSVLSISPDKMLVRFMVPPS